MSRIIIRGGTVLTVSTAHDVLRDTDVVIEGDRIVEVSPDVTAREDDVVIDAAGAIVMPGLVDTHLHMWEYGWRGVVMRKNNGFDYMDLLWKTHSGYSAQDTYESVVGASFETIDHGITSVLDFMHGANTSPEHTDGAVDAYRLTGQRALLAVGTKAKYTADPDDFARARAEKLADVARLTTATAADAAITVGTAIVTPQNSALWGHFRSDVEESRALGARMTFHANEIGEIAMIERAGLLGSDIVPSHGNRASAPELKMMADAGMILSVSPYTEVSSGKSPGIVNRAAHAGVKVAISIDTPPGIMPLNEFAQLRQFWASLVTYDQHVAREGGRFPIDFTLDPHSLTLDQAVEAATVNGAAALGYENLGRIAVGQLADVIVVRPEAGEVALEDPAAYVVMSTPTSRDVTDVVVNGVIRKRAGSLVVPDAVDLDDVNQRARERIMRLVTKVGS